MDVRKVLLGGHGLQQGMVSVKTKGVIVAVISCPVIQIEITGFSDFSLREAPSSETFLLLCNS